MHPIYLLAPPEVPASPPLPWSISSLTVFRKCPRRWWLLNSSYSNTHNGRYPVPYGSAALRGRLVHDAVEAYARNLRAAGTEASEDSFSPRLHIRRSLKTVIGSADENPRTDPRRLSVSIDDCVRDFYDLVESQDFDRRGGPARQPVARQNNRSHSPPSEAAELWLEVEDPAIGGRIDRVVGYGIIDFKTGEPSDDHAEQLKFYAVLWWLKFGFPPHTLGLRYTGGIQPLEMPVPSELELETIAESLRVELAEANHSLSCLPVPARPSSTNCVRCPVRQLCDEYWTSPETLPLRSSQTPATAKRTVSYFDVKILELPPGWLRDGHLVGLARAEVLGDVRLFVERDKCPVEDPVKLTQARLLSAMIVTGADGIEVRATASCEAFWDTIPAV